MNLDPTGWHSFGDAPAGGAAGQETRAAHTQKAAPPRPLSGAASHRNAWLAVGATLLAAVAGTAVFVATMTVAATNRGNNVVVAARSEPSPRGSASGFSTQSADAAGTPLLLLVDVEGAVRSPGLHRVPAGSRVGDAISAAGGYAERADLQAAALTMNLAQPLVDGGKIRVPVLGESAVPLIDAGHLPSLAGSSPGAAGHSGPIDLNHADQTALEGLPGIGPATASKIIAARKGAPFGSLDDLVSRKAVSASTLEKIRALVTVSP